MTVTVLDVAGNRLDIQELVRGHSPSVSKTEEIKPELLRDNEISLLLLGGALCNDATLEKYQENKGGYSAIGDPTEGALIVAAAHSGLWKDELDKKMPPCWRTAFLIQPASAMTTLHKFDSKQLPEALQEKWSAHPEICEAEYLVMTKGAVDSLLEVSNRVYVQGQIETLSEGWKERILLANNHMAEKGMRVLGRGFSPKNQP